MLKLKQTTVAVIALINSAVFAGAMGPMCSPDNVTVPCRSNAFDVAIYALYLQPTYSGGFAYFAGDQVPGKFVSYDYDYDWGFLLEGSYHFGTGNDISVSWGHSDYNYFYNLDNVNSYDWEPRFNHIHFEFGQHADFGDFKNIRFHGGFQYLNFEHDIVARSIDVQTDSLTINLKYYGFGPRFGMDMAYDTNTGFQIYVNGAIGLAVGHNSFTIKQGGNGIALAQQAFLAISPANGGFDKLISNIEGKAGAKYVYQMATGSLILDAGWWWMQFLGGTAQIRGTADPLSLNGPYAGLKYIGAF